MVAALRVVGELSQKIGSKKNKEVTQQLARMFDSFKITGVTDESLQKEGSNESGTSNPPLILCLIFMSLDFIR